MVEVIRVRLRKNKDDDLRSKFDELPDHLDKSSIIRDALRQYFFRQNKSKSISINSKQVKSKIIERSDKTLKNNLDDLLNMF